ncbi:MULTISPECIES: hypothetical protein [Bacillus cereus group]|uniref:hypothetical protein n=1 Tax=Bacillus cereus group TaxID=86661 RepID=UPI0015CF3150|nr:MULTISPECIES: hypothetical protein [Bacillus cereus group]MDA2213694.1 hypothetical protein [Bacillus cereus]MDA2224940.1 hypothetical protein [Bacillus cereus]MDA2252852.1 hypothetical protein [Bacillus cereus]MDA2280676.1 hypothetical protein [Bacillus cereus]MDA2286165.1 hypothetical protein [Bacillus cereus]
MNMQQKQELSLFAEELYRYMSPATLNQLAIEAQLRHFFCTNTIKKGFSIHEVAN